MAALVVALDYKDAGSAIAMVRTLKGAVPWVKVGLELFTAEGPTVVSALKDLGYKVFLDLKFFDIPNTVQGAVRSAVRLGADMVKVNYTGSPDTFHEVVLGCGGHKPDGIRVHPQRPVQAPTDARFTIFTLEGTYPPRFLLADVPPAQDPAPDEAASMILPARDAAAAASNRVTAITAASGFTLTRLHPLPFFSAPGSGNNIGLLPVLIAGRGPWSSVIETLRALENNPGLQIEKLALRPMTNGKDWEVSVRFEQAAWKNEGP